MTCPRCGAPLEPVALGPDSAPWRCAHCHIGWLACELTQEARSAYRYETHDWYPQRIMIEPRRLEMEEAHVRGTSLRPEQLGSVHPTVLERLAKRRLSDDFRALVHNALGIGGSE